MLELDEVVLVRGAIAGDRAALEALWARHRRWLATVVLAHKPATVELEDLLQEIALHVCRKISDLREPQRLRPWLRTVAMNAAVSAGRSAQVRRRLRVVPMEGEQDEPEDPAVRRAAEDAESQRALARALEAAQRLPAEYREPLLLKTVEGLSQRAIAAALDLPETTVETRLARARRMLREQLADLAPGAVARPKPLSAMDGPA